jgi:parvulin-like peptidyl-prolyl isomerase
VWNLPYTDCYRGFFGHGDMQKEFEEAAFRLERGQVSPVVETASGVHLIQRYRLPLHVPKALPI